MPPLVLAGTAAVMTTLLLTPPITAGTAAEWTTSGGLEPHAVTSSCVHRVLPGSGEGLGLGLGSGLGLGLGSGLGFGLGSGLGFGLGSGLASV